MDVHPDDVQIAVARLREDVSLYRYRANMRQTSEAEREVFLRDARAFERVADQLEESVTSERQ